MRKLILISSFILPFYLIAQDCCDAEQLAIYNCGGLGCYIPQCTIDCEWEPMQCWSSTGYCWCVNENGIEIDGTSIPSWQGFPDCEEFTTELNCNIGEVDLGWGNCNNIYSDLYSTLPNGCMPSGCFSIEETIDLNFSYITLGEFPSNIGELVNLEYIHISDCGLTGEIPSNIQNLENLTLLWIYDNDHNLSDSLGINSNLTGTISAEIGSLENLQSLRLDNNELSGSIPPELGNLINMNQLILAGNNLEGEIPLGLMSAISLESLSLENNLLEGPIPLEIGNLQSLDWLSLANNSLTGEIPIQISNLTSLYFLDLSSNRLFGDIPDYFCDIFFINFSDNQFCSPYPECYNEDTIGYQDTSNCDEECFNGIQGDLNFDGVVNILDAVDLVTCILSSHRCNICFDINFDDVINISDVIVLINIILDN
tara:strand:- start:334 stop:1611 length:1278 start_codon:yes stop_codon:yes gene_type:complete